MGSHLSKRVWGNVIGCEPEDVGIGQRVRAVFEEARTPDSNERLLIPQWEIT